jgi:hypothetical protein
MTSDLPELHLKFVPAILADEGTSPTNQPRPPFCH